MDLCIFNQKFTSRNENRHIDHWPIEESRLQWSRNRRTYHRVRIYPQRSKMQTNKQMKKKQIQLVYQRIHWILNEVHGYNKIFRVRFAFLRSPNFIVFEWICVERVCVCLRHKYTHGTPLSVVVGAIFVVTHAEQRDWVTGKSALAQQQYMYVCIIQHVRITPEEKREKKSYVHMISIEFYVGSVRFRFDGIHGRAHIFSSYCLLIVLRVYVCVCVCE